jgi:predicted membrane protein
MGVNAILRFLEFIRRSMESSQMEALFKYYLDLTESVLAKEVFRRWAINCFAERSSSFEAQQLYVLWCICMETAVSSAATSAEVR